MVVGGEGPQCGLVGIFVVPDGSGEREDALQDADGDTGVCASAVSFEIELAFEGVVDRLDDLTQRLEEAAAGPGLFVLERRAQQPNAAFVEEGFELAAGVALVGDDGLTGSAREELGFDLEEIARDVAFIGLGFASANAMGNPAVVHTRCRRSPQKNREWLAQ